jgi:hypothetical protein
VTGFEPVFLPPINRANSTLFNFHDKFCDKFSIFSSIEVNINSLNDIPQSFAACLYFSASSGLTLIEMLDSVLRYAVVAFF